MQTNRPIARSSIPPRPERQPAIGADSPSAGRNEYPPYPTRAALVWTATVAVLVFLGLLIVFILQNQERVYVQYFALTGSVPLGIALSIAALAGGLLVAVAGAIRIAQLQSAATRLRDRSPTRPATKWRAHLLRHGHPAR